jgi:hypothetical protein
MDFAGGAARTPRKSNALDGACSGAIMWLLPSFNRPANLARFFAAFDVTKGSTPGLVLIDAEDYNNNHSDYLALKLPLDWHLRVANGRSQGDKIREVWNEISLFSWFGLIGDDNVAETEGWDARLVHACDGWNIISCNDGWQAPQRLANCWVMGGALVREIGYIFAPGMHHMFVDDMWEIIGREACCWQCHMGVMVRHRHVLRGEAKADATHRQAYGEGPDRMGGYWANDQKAFNAWREGDRERIVAAIRANRPWYNMSNVRRNDPCPCGSGRRYKHCHGSMRSPNIVE